MDSTVCTIQWVIGARTYCRVEQAHLVVQLAGAFYMYILMYLMMQFGPEAAHALRTNVTGLASSAHHQCVAFN